MKKLVVILLLVFFCLNVNSQVSVHAPQSNLPSVNNDTLVISLITKYPAAEIYELYGHEAIRVTGNGYDLAFDYGLFDFDAPNFIYRFVKGETDYLAGCHDFDMFMASCMADGAKVVEQKLNLTAEESQQLFELLSWDVKPENRSYRYNYVKNNCATKILDRLDDAVGHKIDYSDSTQYGSYRNELSHYDRNYAWYQFGIDLILGSGLDYELNRREEMFVPVELMKSAETAYLHDGRKLVTETHIIYEGKEDATLPPTPFILSPIVCCYSLLLLIALLIARDLRRGKINRWLYTFWYGFCGLAGCLVFFLIFISEHEATSPNINGWWLNPFGLLAMILILLKNNKPSVIFMTLNSVVLLLFIASLPFQSQALNYATYPLIIIDFGLSIAYICNKSNRDILPTPFKGFFNNKKQ